MGRPCRSGCWNSCGLSCAFFLPGSGPGCCWRRQDRDRSQDGVCGAPSAATSRRRIPAGGTSRRIQLLRRVRFERFLVDSTIWLGPPRLVRQLGGFQAARRVRPEVAVAYHSPKLDRPVACESTLEAGFYRFLDQAEVVWTYQEQPVSIPLVLDGAQRRYHPDVLVVLVDGRVMLAELKPRLQWGCSRRGGPGVPGAAAGWPVCQR
jgi:hypothetical protein